MLLFGVDFLLFKVGAGTGTGFTPTGADAGGFSDRATSPGSVFVMATSMSASFGVCARTVARTLMSLRLLLRTFT